MNQAATALFDGHAEGLFSLPDEVLAARDRVESARLAQMKVGEAIPSPLDIEDEVAQRLAADPGVDPIKAADEAVEAHRTLDRLKVTERVWAQAVEVAEHALRSTLDAEQDTIVSDHLRRVQEQILASMKKVAPALAGLDLADAHLAFSASEKARSAYRAADQAAVTYGRIRAIYGRLMASDDPADWHERLSRYSEIKNIDQIYPMRSLAFGPGSSASPPWPSHPVERIVWLISTDAEVWMPTRVELEDHVAALEDERRANSPVQHVEMPVVHQTGRTRSGQRPALSRGGKWTENASDLLG